MVKKPKTHSEILWHFPGGSKWDDNENTYSKTRKSPDEAYSIFLKILETKILKISHHREKFNRTVSADLRQNLI